jgi:8-oxo-dGTP pyrophosphatase MutT (NUDIX family)
MSSKQSTYNIAKHQAACVFISRFTTSGKIEILAVSRRDDKTAFGLPGGKVQQGENCIQAAQRELKEETGIDALIIDPIFICTCKSDVDYITTTFHVSVYNGIPKTCDNECEVAWVTPDILIKGPFGKYNKKLFREIGIIFND